MKYLGWSALAAVIGLCGCRSETRPPLTPLTTNQSRLSDTGFTLFEAGQVRPLALSPDGSLLFATNTPDGRLEVFQVGTGTLVPQASIPVGLEPVAVAARSSTEVWVVNHLSDSISVVDVSDLTAARVVRTLLVGDEPRDIVFGGAQFNLAFITTAHRGQNSPIDPQLTTPGVPRADVWVFDANQLDDAGTPLTILSLFCDTPRALAVSPDGSTVYAAAFHSGNRTATVPAFAIGSRGLPPPLTNFEGILGPTVGLIVKYRQSPVDGNMHWLDKLNRSWDDTIRFSLPDQDVFSIDATASPPVQKTGPTDVYTTVGTVLFNMVVNPVTGKVYVSNTDAQNDTRFEGPGAYAYQQSGMHSVRGHLVESRITVLDGANVVSRHLNKHINYDQCCAPIPNPENQASLAFPTGMAISSDGTMLYVSAFGSSKVGVFATSSLEDDSFVPDPANQIQVTGGGPSGIVLDEARGALYVLTRFDNSISIVDTASQQEIAHLPMFNPEPTSVTAGRRFLYDAAFTSSHGDSACASCHIFGDFDSLAWDLGDPDNTRLNNPGPFTVGPFIDPTFHPMKGPMTTQSLRGMDNHGPMHWRGDRTGGNDVPVSAQPNTGTFDEVAGFTKFNVAFQGLVGRDAQLTDVEMRAFTDFVLQIMYPPNPIRNLDNSLNLDQQAGHDFFMGITTGNKPSDTFETCTGCHVLDPNGNSQYPGVVRPGFFGTDGRSSFEGESQILKIPHLRNLYQKAGMFGMPPTSFFPLDPSPFMGDQVRGFGFLHDGSVDTVFRFHGAGVFVKSVFNTGGIPDDDSGRLLRRQLEQFMLAFDSNLAPIVGQQMTLTPNSPSTAQSRIDLLEQRAAQGECDLIAKGQVNGQAAGFLYQPSNGTFARSQSTDPPRSDADLRALATVAGGELTFTCAPPGDGTRIANEL